MGRRGRSKERTPEYFTVDVERLDQEGRGIAHLDGKVVFIQGALPGERVTYERLRSKSSFDIGRTSAVLTQSWARVAPRCPKFGFGPGSCGGCTMQHIEPNAQVAFKERILMDTLWHIGKNKNLPLYNAGQQSYGFSMQQRLGGAFRLCTGYHFSAYKKIGGIRPDRSQKTR